MGDRRKLLLGVGLGFLAWLTACGGRSVSESSGRAGASAATGGAGTLASGSVGGGMSQGGAPCCNLVLSCNPEDVTLDDALQCPTGATCYALEACCGRATHCAHYAHVYPDPQPDPGPCSLLGEWSAYSLPWNGQSTAAVITFVKDGTLSGTPSFTGSWLLEGSTLTIRDTVGADMTCPFSDHWLLTFSSDCQTAPLVPIDSGCTGARRYLDWDVTLTRNLVK